MQTEFAFSDGTGLLYDSITWTIERRQCADATRAQHLDHRRWLLEFFGDVPVHTIDFHAVTKYVDHERARGLTNTTIRKRLVTLRMALEDCYRRGLLKRSTDWWPELESDTKPGNDLWTYDQWRAGRIAFEPSQRIGIDVLWWTGMHLSDVKRWRRSDVQLASGEWTRYNTKSKADPAVLPLPAEFAAILERWFADERPGPAHRVAPLFWDFPIKPMARVCERAGMPRITTLGLRRSCVSYQFELGRKKGMAGDAIADFVALWLGHKGDPRTSSIIRRHYHRWTPEAIKAGSVF